MFLLLFGLHRSEVSFIGGLRVAFFEFAFVFGGVTALGGQGGRLHGT